MSAFVAPKSVFSPSMTASTSAAAPVRLEVKPSAKVFQLHADVVLLAVAAGAGADDVAALLMEEASGFWAAGFGFAISADVFDPASSSSSARISAVSPLSTVARIFKSDAS